MYSIVIDGRQYYSYTNGVVGEAHSVDLLQIYNSDAIFKQSNVTAVATIHNHVVSREFSPVDKGFAENKYRNILPDLYACFMVAYGDTPGTANIYKYSDTRKGYQQQTVCTGLSYNLLTSNRKQELAANTILKKRWEEHLNTCRDPKCVKRHWPKGK